MTASFRILWHEDAEREFLMVPFPTRRGLNQRLMSLKHSVSPSGAHRIGDTSSYRLHYYDWSAIYDVDEESRTITIQAIRR